MTTALATPRAITDLDREQWAATLYAARVLRRCNPSVEGDRAKFRAAKAALVALLPVDADASDLIAQAVRWYALNDVALAFCGMQQAETSREREVSNGLPSAR